MKSKRLACLTVSLALFAGCATTRFKPEGYTSRQAEQRLNDLRFACRDIPMGSAVNVKFYENASVTEQVGFQEMVGYFYAFNWMTDTVYISPKPLTLFDRGEPYDLLYVQNIIPMTPAAPTIPLVQKPDFELALLTR